MTTAKSPNNITIDTITNGLSFNGNPLIKPAGVSLPIPYEFIDEYERCSWDAEYFIENYCKIISLDDGIIPFKPYEFQKKIIATAIENRFVIIKAPRQCGKCFRINTLVRIRSRITGEIYEIDGKELHARIKSARSKNSTVL